MIGVQRAIFPGLALGCIFLVFITGLISKPGRTLASSLPVAMERQVDTRPGATPLQPEEVSPQTEFSAALPVVNLEVVQEPVKAEEPPPSQAEEETSQPECTLNSGYPAAIQQWCSHIERYAGENELDPDLVAAVMLQESAGRPDAYSKSGAVGLLQVMPRDGLAASFMCINGPCFAARPSMAELYDPEFNIDYGVRMLAGLIRKYGDVREGLRAYGPMNYGYRYADIILNIMSRYE